MGPVVIINIELIKITNKIFSNKNQITKLYTLVFKESAYIFISKRLTRYTPNIYKINEVMRHSLNNFSSISKYCLILKFTKIFQSNSID